MPSFSVASDTKGSHERAVSMPRRATCRLTALLVVAVAVPLLNVSPAVAHHITGETYTGTHAGGGSFSLTVSADGTRIASISVSGPATWQEGNCEFGGTTAAVKSPEIVDNHNHHTFSNINFGEGTPTFGGLQGEFPITPRTIGPGTPALTQASGTLRLYYEPDPVQPRCFTGVLTWTAVEAWPPGTPECYAALGPYDKAFRKLKNAKKALREAHTPDAEMRASKKLKKAKKRFGKARNKRIAACRDPGIGSFGLGRATWLAGSWSP